MQCFDFGRNRLLSCIYPMHPKAVLDLRMREVERNNSIVQMINAHDLKKTGYLALQARVMPSKKWSYVEDGEPRPIQKFIDEYDGKYRVLIIDVTNYAAQRIHSEKSLVVHARDYSHSFERGMSLYVPREGYLDVPGSF